MLLPGAEPTLLDLKWNTGVMPAAEYDALFAEVKRAYTLTQSLPSVVTLIHDAEHRVDNEAAFRWLNSRLGKVAAENRQPLRAPSQDEPTGDGPPLNRAR